MDLKLTSLAYTKEIEPGVIGMYNGISGHNFVFTTDGVFSDLKSGKLPKRKEDLQELIDKHFLVPSSFSEKDYLERLKKSQNQDKTLMYLLLSQSCNLSCTYCFEHLGPDMGKLMPWSVADKAIDFFSRVSVPKRTIVFYGGEPLLDEEVFVKSVDKIRRMGLECRLSMVSNGTLITPELAEYIAKNKVDVGVSIDGPKEIHDRARVMRDGSGGSFDDAIRGYNYLKEKGVNPSISCTIGKHNVKELEDVARFFVSELKPKGVGFNLMMGGKNDEGAMREATEQLLKAYEILRNNGIYEDRVMRRLKAITTGKNHLKDCGAYGNQFAVRYDGKVGPCHGFCNSGEYFSGDIKDDDFKLDEEVFGKWGSRSQLTTPACKDCPSALICGGGCALNSQKEFGGFDEVDKRVCIHSSMLLDWIMRETWKSKRDDYPTVCVCD
jgi:uncharacterized protein